MSKKLASKVKKASKKITVDASGINLKSQAGFVSTSKFLEQIQMTDMVKDCTAVIRGNNASYQFHGRESLTGSVRPGKPCVKPLKVCLSSVLRIVT